MVTNRKFSASDVAVGDQTARRAATGGASAPGQEWSLWAVRMTLQRPKLTETGYRALREAGDAFTSIRGKRRTPGDS